MNESSEMPDEDGMLPDYSGLLRNGVRGKYAGRLTPRIFPAAPLTDQEAALMTMPPSEAAFPVSSPDAHEAAKQWREILKQAREEGLDADRA